MNGNILLRGPDGCTYTAKPFSDYFGKGYLIERFSSMPYCSEWWESITRSQWGRTLFVEELSMFDILSELPEGQCE